jgi:hypothetical protein
LQSKPPKRKLEKLTAKKIKSKNENEDESDEGEIYGTRIEQKKT